MSRNSYLIRVGACGEAVKCSGEEESRFNRGDRVVLQTDRGKMLAGVLQQLLETPTSKSSTEESDAELMQSRILRIANEDDLSQQQQLESKAKEDFLLWSQRIDDWKVDVELVDLEWTLDGEKLILYVLNDRGPECTKLAVQAEAEGLGIIDVVPVSANGVAIPEKESSGCGCGSGGGGCSK